jgi:hypothetical protein
LVQGVLAGMLLRERYPNVPLTEAHPKAYLWISGAASPGKPPRVISAGGMPQQFTMTGTGHADHVRDAAIACLSAWAMVRKPPGWSDLYTQEEGALSPLAAPLGYWMPI